jgi:hypothetical protein
LSEFDLIAWAGLRFRSDLHCGYTARARRELN